jgi:UDP-N-acetylmuramate dehydrogenase
MLSIKKNISLKAYNSLRIDAVAEFFFEATSEEECIEAIVYARNNNLKLQIVGEGTNLVLSKSRYNGLILKNSIKGKSIHEGLACISSGEAWHDSVLWSLDNNLFGLENLSLIPGSVGAAPVQNIGAYGRDISEFIDSVRAINLETLEIETLNNTQCDFSYRNSLFKLKPIYLITEVILKLSKEPTIDVSYKSLSNHMKEKNISEYTPYEVCKAVCEIRNKTLPNPLTNPNVGSFFKNIILEKAEYLALQKILDTPYNLDKQGNYKISTAFLIEQAGWRGKSAGELSVSSDHSLVLLSSGLASGEQVLNFAKNIIEDIKIKFNVSLEIEPSII